MEDLSFESCPHPIIITSWYERKPIGQKCGCGKCSQPDPSPQQLQRRIDMMSKEDIKRYIHRMDD